MSREQGSIIKPSSDVSCIGKQEENEVIIRHSVEVNTIAVKKWFRSLTISSFYASGR